LSKQILGAHPSQPHFFAKVFSAKDGMTTSTIPHRRLSEGAGMRAETVIGMRALLVRHHVSPETRKLSEQYREAMQRLGFEAEQKQLRRFPTNLRLKRVTLRRSC